MNIHSDSETDQEGEYEEVFDDGKRRIRKRKTVDYFLFPDLTIQRHIDNLISNYHSSSIIRPIPVDITNSDYLLTLSELATHATKVGSVRQIGHMTTKIPFFQTEIAKFITTMNQNTVKIETAAVVSKIEMDTIKMLREDFYPESLVEDQFAGLCCSGGTVGNITALWTARNKLGAGVVVGSAMMHYSFNKAADILSLNIHHIQTNEQYCVEIAEMRDYLALNRGKVTCIVGVCGTTETGSIDDLRALGRLAKEFGCWFHVDAAWGGPMIFSAELKSKMDGIELADSICIDGHKQLYTPMGLGVLIFKLKKDMNYIKRNANYILREGSQDLGQFSLEGSRPANSLYLHATLMIIGKKGVGEILNRSCAMTKQMATRLHEHPLKCFQVFFKPMSNILLFRYIPSSHRDTEVYTEEQEKVLDSIVERTQDYISQVVDDTPVCFISRTKVNFKGRMCPAFRVVLANPLTKWSDIETGICEQIKVCEKMVVMLEMEKIRNSLQLWNGWPYEL